MDIHTSSLFDLRRTLAGEFLSAFPYPWEALGKIEEFLLGLFDSLDDNFLKIKEGVFVHATAKIAQTAQLHPPCIICAHADIRTCAYVRGCVLIGEGCVVGNSTELKNCILFDGVQVPHFNYVGDSILGFRAHFGAGAICSNVRLDRGEVIVRGEENFRTGRYKVGAFVGDNAQVGCNSVLAPGCVLGKGAQVPPLTFIRGCRE